MKKRLVATAFGLLLFAGGVQASSIITDVQNNPFKDSIYNVVEKGYMGYTSDKGTFSPDQYITRGQLAQILTNFEKELEASQETKLEDSDTGLTMVSETMKALVKIQVDNVKGAGVFIGETTILTAYHVIDSSKGDDIQIHLSNYKDAISGKVIAKDQWNDLALIKIDDTLKNDNYEVKVLDLAHEAVGLGETVYAFGHPRTLEFAVTRGIISSTDQVVGMKSMQQFDGSIHPGNSGGPLVNENGELVGIVTDVLSSDDNTGQYDGLAFSASYKSIRSFLLENPY